MFTTPEIKCPCPSCRSGPPDIIEVPGFRSTYLVRRLSCGMNTGLKKTRRAALRVRNATAGGE